MKKIETTTETPATNLTPETSAPSAAHSATPTFNPTPTPPHSPTPDLLQSLVTTLQTYVVLPPHAAEALALWTLHIQGEQAKGYVIDEMNDAFRRYIPKSEVDRIREEFEANQEEESERSCTAKTQPQTTGNAESNWQSN